MEVKDIYAEINRLHKLREEMHSDEKDRLVSELKSLSWLNGVRVRYKQGYFAVGLHRHILEIVDHPPILDRVRNHYITSMVIFGDDSAYGDNVVLRPGIAWDGSTIETNYGQTLRVFVEASGVVFDCRETDKAAYQTVLDHLSGRE